MIIDFPVDQKHYAEYCVGCHQQGGIVIKTVSGSIPRVHCSLCGKDNERAIIIDPKLQWWVDDKKQYWHKSVGILVVNKEGRVLVIERAKFPAGYSVPAGHIDNNEDAVAAVKREVHEEVGLTIDEPTRVVEAAIHNDSCRRGCDDHMWELFAVSLPHGQNVAYDEDEASAVVWMSLNELSVQNTPYAMKYILSNYKNELNSAVDRLTTTISD